MNYYYSPDETGRVAQARESYLGRLLTNAQFDEAMSITGILEAEIYKSGRFKEKLGDYAHAFARTERFDVMKAESTLRDLFKARVGQTMNELREGLAAREQEIRMDQPTRMHVKQATAKIATRIEEGDKITFNRAYAENAQDLATEFGITNAGAKRLMHEVHEDETGGQLYDWGKDLEEKHYRPQIEAEKAERQAQAEARTKTRTRSSQTKKRAMAGPSR
ncbi:MAG: hypothetical protein AAFO77_02275 [Pseudomonadota bacterium]